MTSAPLVKSHYSDPTIQDHGFVNHIHHVVRDMGVVPGTTIPLIEAYKIELIQKIGSSSGTGGKPRNIALFRKVLNQADPSAGAWQLIEMWEELIDYDDASAAGSVDIDPITGVVHILMSFGKRRADGALQFQPWEAFVARAAFASPIERPPIGGVPGPQGPPGAPGSGGITLFPAPLISSVWTGRTLNGGVLVDVPVVFGAPVARAYLIRFVASAAMPDIRVRAGTETDPAILTMNTQIAGLQQHIQGWAPGPQVYISTVNGPAQVWLQIVGYAN